MTEIRIENLTKRYGAVTAVNDITLTVSAGELFFLLGPSGCGKTTLLRLIAGFLEPDAGTISFGDRRIDTVPAHQRNTGMVFQNYALWPHMNVRQNVAYGLDVRRVTRRRRRAAWRRSSTLVRMSGLEKRYPNELSGGQQQRVALARALVIEPDVVLLDEPLSNLDAKLRLEMRAEIRRIHDRSPRTFVYVTHDQKEALSMADRIAVMNEGRIVQIGTPEEVYTEPSSLFCARFLGNANALAGHAAFGRRARSPTWRPAAGSRSPRASARRRLASASRAVVAVRPELLHPPPTARRTPSTRASLSRMYLGEMVQYQLRAGDAEMSATAQARRSGARGRTTPSASPSTRWPRSRFRSDGCCCC